MAASPPLLKLSTITHGESNYFLDNKCFHSFAHHISASSLEKHQVNTSQALARTMKNNLTTIIEHEAKLQAPMGILTTHLCKNLGSIVRGIEIYIFAKNKLQSDLVSSQVVLALGFRLGDF